MTEILAVSKQGVNVLTETNPNNFIFNSKYNTFKIVYQGLIDIPITVGTANYQFAHNSPLVSTTCLTVFAKWLDGKVNNITPLTQGIRSFNEAKSLNNIYFDNTNIYINYGFVAANYTLHLAWLIYEASL